MEKAAPVRSRLLYALTFRITILGFITGTFGAGLTGGRGFGAETVYRKGAKCAGVGKLV